MICSVAPGAGSPSIALVLASSTDPPCAGTGRSVCVVDAVASVWVCAGVEPEKHGNEKVRMIAFTMLDFFSKCLSWAGKRAKPAQGTLDEARSVTKLRRGIPPAIHRPITENYFKN
ncbi:hypothetical protein HBDW_10510 [Herbaspirillum sp. DW155]|uniref:hypothetical protein n=1 Tax=Herbaspirillum sp. DW155 TaxID=3095609 RepID=UPI00308921A4|nr:hypothetical protein HBDW_10510 [Herbaspirillum sp. DW155]